MSDTNRPRDDADDAGWADGPETPSLIDRLKGFFARAEDQAEEPPAVPERAAPKARREMMDRVMAFDAKRIIDVMSPRADIIAVEIDTPLDALVRAFCDAGHSRLPIYRRDLDDPVGMAHIKDVLALVADPSRLAPGEAPLRRIKREVLYVPPSMRVTDLLVKMQALRVHMALVIDEYGGTDGLVTIEDLVEEIVGDINDEHDDTEQPVILARASGGWEADARVELEDFTRKTGVQFSSEDEEVDTLGGLVASLAGRVPERGEVLSHPDGWDFEIVDADARKVRKIRIRKSLADSGGPVSPRAAG
jgi:CBS domain containing-hemolysin-like protein